MNTNFLHFHIIPTTFCNKSCPYCINSNKKFNEIDFNDYKQFIKLLFALQKNYKIILEFNGGEFTLSKNLYNYFKYLDKLNLYRLILTTNFNSPNYKYKKILEILNSINIKCNKLEFFVTFHFDKNNQFLKKIIQFLNDTQSYDYIFTINLIKGLPLIENNWYKYLNEMKKIDDPRFKINYSEYIQKSNINHGKTFNFNDKKLCRGGIYYFLGGSIINDACRSKSYPISKFKPNFDLIYCNKTCPNQDFSLKIFKPKILRKVNDKFKRKSDKKINKTG